MSVRIEKISSRDRRHKRIRSRMHGTSQRPRLAVFRSLRHMVAQIIDDSLGHTLVAVTDQEITDAKLTKTDLAYKTGELLGQRATEKGIESVVFDRGGYRYHGRVKALAEGARAASLKF